MRVLALSLVLGLLATQAVAEVREEVRLLMAEAASMKPADFPAAMRQYLLLREADALVERALTAGPPDKELAPLIKAAAARVAGFCEGRAPRDCLFAEAERIAMGVEGIVPEMPSMTIRGRAEVLGYLAYALAEAGRFTEAERIIAVNADSIWHEDWLSGLITLLAQAGQFSEAKRVAAGIEDPATLGRSLNQIALELAHAGQSEAVLPVLAKAELAAAGIEDLEFQALVLSETARTYAEARQFAEAERVTAAIQDPFGRDWALRDIAVAYAAAGRLTDAERVITGIVDAFWRVGARAGIGVELMRAGQTGPALQQVAAAETIVAEIPDTSDRVSALREIGYTFIEAAEIRATPLQLAEAERVAGLIANIEGDDWQVFLALNTIAAMLHAVSQDAAALRQFDVAERIAMRIGDAQRRGSALEALVAERAEAGQIAEAERIATGIETTDSKTAALGSIAVAYAKAELGSAATEHVSEAERIAAVILRIGNKGYWVDSPLQAIAVALAEAGQSIEAERIARSIPDADWRVMTLNGTVEVLAGAGRFSEAERIARGIEDAGYRALALSGIAKVLGD
jgi:tetratricopeptide (TPR) repeat protein